MPIKSRRPSKSVAAKSAEMAVAVPQVIMHRLSRMAMAGSSPSDSDRREFQKMVAEKQTAFSQAWIAMAAETFRANQLIGSALFRSFISSRSRSKSLASIPRMVQNAGNAVVAKGMAPIHRKAVANSKRLAKPKPR